MLQILSHLPDVENVKYITSDIESNPLPTTAKEGDIAIADGNVFQWHNGGWTLDNERTQKAFFAFYNGDLYKYTDGDLELAVKLPDASSPTNSDNTQNAFNIRVWGNDYQQADTWEKGDLLYNPDDNTLQRCTAGTDVAPTPDFEPATFDTTSLYHLIGTPQWYAYDEDAQTLRPLTNDDTPADSTIADTVNTLAGKLSAIQTAIAALSDNLNRLADEVHGTTPSDDDPDTPATDDTPKPFDPITCNPGALSINKMPEDITLDDVTAALTIPDLCEESDLWLASAAGLQPGTTTKIINSNASLLRTLTSAESECPGLIIDGEYYINNSGAIVIEKDFTLVGTEAMGGENGKLIAKNGVLFKTTHSLHIRDVRFYRDYNYGSYLITIDTTEGIGSLQIMGCEFINEGYGACTINLTADRSLWPMDANDVPIDTNCIKHINIHGNTCKGGRNFIHSNGIRVTDSWRITGNTVSNIWMTGILFGSNDNPEAEETTFSKYMYYMSCPMYVVGNKFYGRDYIVYMLRNETQDFIAGKAFLTSGKSYKPAVYDFYANVTRVYYCNNTVRNLLRLTYGETNDREDVGIMKMKNVGVPDEWLDPHCTKCMKPVRYYKDNLFSCTGDDYTRFLNDYWNARTYDDSHDTAAERAYDDALEADALTFAHATALHMTMQITKYVFPPKIEIKGNTIQYPMIEGISTGTNIMCDLLQVTGNKFLSDYIASEETPANGYLFSIRALRAEITDNEFAAKDSTIRLVYNKKYAERGDLDYAELEISGNRLGAGSSFKNANYNIASGGNVPTRTQYTLPE